MADRWPLVGRDDELAYVLRSVQERDGVLLAGDAGVGKSRLAAEVLAAAEADGWSTVSFGVSPESATIPFAPFAPLLSEDAAGDGVDRFMVAARALQARGDRVILHIDDAHLLDEVSIAFVRHLLATDVVRVLLTALSGAPMPPALVSAWQSEMVLRIELQPLARREVKRLLEDVLGGPVDLATTRWIWRTSAGNPLYVRELVLDALETESLEQRRGRWTLTTPTDGPRPRLLEVVAGRLGALADAEREALELLAVGEPLGLPLFEQLAGDDVVQSLERHGLIATRQDRRRTVVSCAHPLHGEVLRNGLGSSTARARRRRLIDAVSAAGAARSGDTLRLALWRCEVGDTSDWPGLLEAAKDLAKAFDRPLIAIARGEKHEDELVAVGRSHLEVALRLAEAGFERGRTVDGAFVVFSLLMRLGRFEEAAAVDASVDELVTSDEDRLAAARIRASAAFFYGGDVDRAIAQLREVEQTATEPAIRFSARLVVAQLHVFSRRHLAEAVELGLGVGDAPDVPRLEALAGPATAAVALAELGRSTEGLEVLDRLIADVRGDDDTTALALIMAARIIVLALGARYAEAEQLATMTQQLAVAVGDDEGAGVSASMLASITLAQGRVRTAVRWAEEATHRLADVDILGAARAAVVHAALAHALAGEVEAATAGLSRLERFPRTTGWNDEDEVEARAWLDVATGRSSAALARLQAAAERAELEGRPMRELRLLHDIARLGNAGAVVERVAELAPTVDSALAAPIADFVCGAAEPDATKLAAAAEAFAGAGTRLLEAEAWAQASVVLEAAGMRSSAASTSARSRLAAEQCEGASTPALVLGGPTQLLTKREREVAELAARGLTDREIAETLVVSIRTVQTHLYNAYAKLGVEGRAGLPGVLGT